MKRKYVARTHDFILIVLENAKEQLLNKKELQNPMGFIEDYTIIKPKYAED